MVRRSFRFSRTFATIPMVGAAGILAAATAAIGNAQAVPRITGQVENSPLVSLPGEVHPWAQARFDRGVAPANLRGRMLLVMRRSPAQESALQSMIAAQQDPNSTNYHKWLTPDQFGKQFGVADADVQTVTAYLGSRGLSVGRIYGSHMAIEVTATAEQVHSTFQTEIHAYSVGGKTFYANATAPKIPAALQGVISGITSLNNFKTTIAPTAGTQASFNPETHKLAPLYTISGGATYGISPGDLAKIYHIPAATSTLGEGGQNVNVGVLGDSNIDVNYINNYRSVFKLGAKAPVVIVDGNDPGMNDDASIAYKQIELIAAVAPNANIYYYTSAGTDYDANGLDFAIIRAVEDNQVQVLLNGYQTCETTLKSGEMLFFNQLAEQAAAQGITFVAAAGNTGSAGCETPGTAGPATSALAVNGYASSPFVTAVGGTDFYYDGVTTYWNATNTAPTSATPYTSAKGYIPEQVWNNSNTANTGSGPSVLLAGGGGVSTYGGSFDVNNNPLPQPIPSYQSSNANASAIGGAARVLPDVSFFAGGGPNNTIGYGGDPATQYNDTAYMFCMQSTDCGTGTPPRFTYAGGTEASSAVFAGAMALVVERFNSNTSAYGMGNANPSLYYLLTNNKVGGHDIALGSNAVDCTGANNCAGGLMTGYAAGTGYDAATGLGSFDITSFVTNYNATPKTVASTTTLSVLDPKTGLAPVCGATPNCAVHSQTLELKVHVTGSGGTPTGDVMVLSTNQLASQSGVSPVMTLTSGTADDNYDKLLPGGTYNLFARYAGDSKFGSSVSAQFPITIQPEPCHVTVYKNTAVGTVTYGTPITITAEPYSNASSDSVAPPSGAFNIVDNGTTITTAPFNSEGATTFSSNLLPFGLNKLQLVFPGDASFLGCSTPVYTVNIAKAATKTILSPANGDAAGGNLAMTALVESASLPSNGTSPTGTVTFNTNPARTVPLVAGFDVNGNAIATANVIVQGGQINGGQVKATYNPASTELNYKGSSTTVNVANNGALLNGNTTTAFTISDTYGSPNGGPYPAQDSLTLNIQVSSAVGGFNPQGCRILCSSPTVSIYADGVLLAANLTTNPDGTFAYVVPQQNGYLALPSGQVQFSVIYSGYTVIGPIGQYNASSAYQTVTINDDRTTADFSLQSDTTVNQTAPLVSTGATQASYNLRLTSIYNFQSAYGATPINLGCSVVGYTNKSGLRSAPVGLTCGFGSLASTTTSVNFASNSVATGFITQTLYVGAASGYDIASSTTPAQPAAPWWLATGGTTLACIFLLGLPKRRRNWQSMLGACVMAIVSFGMTGCGATLTSNATKQTGNSLSGGNASPSAGGTAVSTGTYTVLVTASSTTNAAIVHTLPVQVIVGN